MPGPTIHWILVGPHEASSSRIHGYNVHRYLLAHGWDSRILFSPPVWTLDPPLTAEALGRGSTVQPGDVVVLQKVRGARTLALLKALRERGVQTLYIDCDLPLKTCEAGLASLTVCSSKRLAEMYRECGIVGATCIPDAIEWTGPSPSSHKGSNGEGPLRCVWFGNIDHERLKQLAAFGALLAEHCPRWLLVTVSDHDSADVRWSITGAQEFIPKCDAAVILSSGTAKGDAKSSNRAVQAMAAGLPVAAYPIPAYREVIQPGVTGFLCGKDHEWVAALRSLEDPNRRLFMAQSAHRFAVANFAMARIGPMWEETILRLGEVSEQPRS